MLHTAAVLRFLPHSLPRFKKIVVDRFGFQLIFEILMLKECNDSSFANPPNYSKFVTCVQSAVKKKRPHHHRDIRGVSSVVH